ncbi:endolytic transglycosylase MltG [Streptomyces sp. G-G2]|uniref:endolytic transglycosylase MltG n=1 Tax=Streptomyces sp. G-G2 TaxID=3046201 RepID=UPI0024BA4EAC|nr:endolytic transglycosylase MltG [Streptomyces sp. G-G2]MDJ0381032.1 endolytic transglycosylase MltG [Streptomyces sp. G-G2]
MTDYGRGSGPEPWHPEDPLYGDGYAHQTQQGQVPYADQQQYPQEPQEPQYQQYPQQQYQGYAPEQQQQPQPQPQQPQHHQQHPQQQYPQAQHQAPHQPQQPVYADQGAQNWDTGQGQQAVPYGVDPYAQQPVAYPGEAPDPYATAEAYPPPQPPGRRHLIPEPGTEWQDENAEPQDAEDESLLAADGDDGDEPSSGRRAGRGKGGKTKGRKRTGSACLIAALVIVGAVGGVGYYGFSYVKAKLGMADDYAGEGTTSIDVEIPKGATLGRMGSILQKAGVVASAEAFVNAAQNNPKGGGIQPGLYPLRKQMSAKSVVDLMVDPSKLNVIIVAEGLRNEQVYGAIDKKLKLQEGTTQEVAKRELKTLGLPAWAEGGELKLKDPLEGFLYPARYDLSTGITPQDLLKKMVKNATEKYAALNIEAKAREVGLKSPLELITVASLVQAEGKNHEDYRKMAAVIYNRLKPTNTATNQKLEFDSTINYIKGTSNINVSVAETRAIEDPYNTYRNRGLPPGAISNPGSDALKAVLNPDKDAWMFFVSVDGDTTTFTKTLAEHNKLVAEFNERQAQKKQQNGG